MEEMKVKGDWRGCHSPIPDVVDLYLENEPLARLRDCLGMHENAIPGRVMKSLRDFLETKPKNISFSEDNGFPMPTGARLDTKIFPGIAQRTLTVVMGDLANGRGHSGQCRTCPACGTIETRVQASHTHIFPAEARPILLASYVCPTDWYKGAQHACSTDQVQSGRKHLLIATHTCPTCISFASAPPREIGRTCNSDALTCPTSVRANHSLAGPTEHLSIPNLTCAAYRYQPGEPTASTSSNTSRKMAKLKH